MMTSQGNYVPLVSNIVFYIDTTLVCANSDTSQQIQWYYLPTQTSTPISKTRSSQWNANTEISILDIMTSSEGYYVCQVLNQATAYIATIFNMDNTISVILLIFIDNLFLYCSDFIFRIFTWNDRDVLFHTTTISLQEFYFVILLTMELVRLMSLDYLTQLRQQVSLFMQINLMLTTWQTYYV